MHIFNPQNMKKLDREERKTMFKAKDIWEEAGLKAGMTAADIGCGTGFFTFDAAQIVGESGMVFALDIQEPMIAELTRRAQERLVNNIKPIVTNEDSLVLPQHTVDIAFMAFVLHEVEEKLKFVQETYRIIKPGGTVCILEWEKTDTEKGSALKERISVEEAKAFIENAGFREVVYREYNPDTYLIFGKK